MTVVAVARSGLALSAPLRAALQVLLLGMLVAEQGRHRAAATAAAVAFQPSAPTARRPAFAGASFRQQQQQQGGVFFGGDDANRPDHLPGFARRRRGRTSSPLPTALSLSSKSSDDPEEGGADLAAEFFKMAQEKGINLDPRDILDEDDEGDDEEDEGEEDDEEEDDDEPEPNIPQGAINAFLGYETVDVGEKLAGNVSLTDRQLYSEVKERVLDTAGGFVDFVKAARDEEDDDDEEEEEDSGEAKPYEAPTTVPDSDLTAGEVVILVLNAILHNDVPTPNRGVEILFGYSSDGSQIKNEVGLTPAEYADFLKETEYKVLFSHQGASIDKADYSFDGKKAFFTARLKTGPGALDVVSVNFILSTKGVEDDACWLVDSMLIRPQSMRRRRRR